MAKEQDDPRKSPPLPPMGRTGPRPFEMPQSAESLAQATPPSPIPNLEEWKRDMARRQRGFRPGASVNFERARRELNLTPQEQYLYRHHLDNLARGGFVHGPAGTPSPGDWPPRTLSPVEQGSISTLYQTTQEHNGRYYNLPTVWDGQIVNEDQALQRALQAGIDKFPSYPSEKAANDRYTAMHKYLGDDVRQWFER